MLNPDNTATEQFGIAVQPGIATRQTLLTHQRLSM